jgi:hydroxymethylpyrimidine/phosphomethylpyrimidine kinase
MKTVLTIAGSDSGGGAGIQADLKTFAAFGVYGTCAITAVTAQNTKAVTGVWKLPADFVAKQIDAVMTDIGADAWKTGMLATPEIVEVVAERAKYYQVKSLVVDPVMMSKGGQFLLSLDARTTLIKKLIPLAFVITPNCDEARIITEHSINNVEDMKKAATAIYKMGAKNVVVKGGHLGKGYSAIDIAYDGNKFSEIISRRINTKNTHGIGCTYASVIAAGIAKGYPVLTAIKKAKRYLDLAIKKGANLHIGHGFGPLNHFPKKQIF